MTFRKIIMLSIICFFNLTLSAQDYPLDLDDTTKAISNAAFRTLVKRDVSFAIIGERLPSSGFILSLDKPKGTVQGILPSKKGIHTLNIGLGVTDNIYTIFSNNSFNSIFDASINFNFTNKAIYKYSLRRARIAKRKINKKAKNPSREAIQDTLYAYTSLINWKFPKDSIEKEFVQKLELQDTNKNAKLISKNHRESIIKKIAIELDKTNTIDSTDNIKSIKAKWIDSLKNEDIKITKLFNDFDRLKKTFTNFKKNMIEYELKESKNVWTQKRPFWYSITPFYEGQSVEIFESSIIDKKSQVIHSFGIKGGVNYYNLRPNSFFYFKAELLLSYGHNINEFKKVNFVQTDTIATGNGQLFTSETKGAAYTNEELKEGFIGGVDTEIYWIPNRISFVPGVYSRITFRYSKIFEDDIQIPFELGTVFNLKSSKKDVNSVSILPHVRWQNILAKTDEESIEGNFSVGIRFGIPINF